MGEKKSYPIIPGARASGAQKFGAFVKPVKFTNYGPEASGGRWCHRYAVLSMRQIVDHISKYPITVAMINACLGAAGGLTFWA